MTSYAESKPIAWVQPVLRGYKLACCVVVLLLVGCVDKPVLVRPVTLPTVAAPVLTAIPAAAFTCPVPLPAPYTLCMTDDTYKVLAGRERAAWDWGAAQHAIIETNNEKAKSPEK